MLETNSPEHRVVPILFRLLRERAGLRQSDLAARVGVPQSTISKIETGERRLDLMEARALCSAMGSSLEELARMIEVKMSNGVNP